MPSGGHNKVVLSPEQTADLVARYQSGQSHREIANTIGLTATVVYKVLKAQGVMRTKKSR